MHTRLLQSSDAHPVVVLPLDFPVRLRQIGGTVATIALVSVFVFGGVEVAHAGTTVTLAGFTSSGATNSSLVANSNISGTADPLAPITVTMTNSGSTSTYCTATTDQLGHWICPSGAQVPFGSTTFTASDGTTSATSTAVTIYGTDGPSLTSPTSGSSVLPEYPVFSGTGPARGSITVLANTGGPVCTVALVPDSGQWSCYSAATLPDGANGFTINSSTPGYPSDTFYSGTSATVPVTVSELTPPTVSYVVGYATASSTTTTSFDNAAIETDLFSVTEPGGAGTGYLRASNPNPSCGPVVAPGPLACDFGTLAPGIWEVHSFQYVGEMTPVARNDFFRIPETPTMTATAQSDQTVAFSGTGTTGDLVSVTATGGSDGGTTVCTATVAGGTWSCTAAATTPGNHSYHASQLDQGWTPYPDSGNAANVDGSPLGVVLSGRSALTTTATVIVAAPASPPAAPTMSYVMGYGTGSSTATGPEGALIHTELYSVTEPEGEGNGYTFGDPVVGCYPDSGGPAGFVGADTVTASFASASTVTAAGMQSTVQPCDFGTLAPGIWNVYSGQNVDGLDSPMQNDFFRIPVAPTMTATGNADQTVSFSGTGTTGDLVSVIADGGSTVCSATVVASNWSCASAASSVGDHSYRAYQLDQGWAPYTDEGGEVGGDPLGVVLSGKSALTSPAAVTIPAASIPAVPTPTTPPAVQSILNWLLTVTGLNGPLHSGDTVTLSSTGLPAGSTVNLFLHSTPISLGSAVVASNGTFSKTVVIPEGVEPGDHHFVATLVTTGNAPSTVETPVTIAAPEQLTTLAEPQTPQSTSDTAAGSKTGHAKAPGTPDKRNTLSAPSSFTNALPTLATLFDNPGALAVAVGLALAIMLLAALPTEILDSAVSSNLDRFGPFLARAGSWAERATAWLNRVTHGPAASSAVMIVLSSIIFGFADPSYGFNLVSLRLTLSIIVGLYVVYYIAPRISGAFIRKRWGLTSEIAIQPTALIFAIIGVIVGRLLGFSPGFLIGLAIGLELAANAKTLHKARSMAVQVAVIVGLSLLAWVGYSLVALAVGGGEGTVWTGLVQDALTTITAEGLTGMLLGLFPLAFFEGKEVWDHSKWLWAALFLVTGTAFSLLVLPTAVAPQKIGESLPVWLLVLGCFTVLSLGVWLYLKLTAKPESESAEAEPERVETPERCVTSRGDTQLLCGRAPVA